MLAGNNFTLQNGLHICIDWLSWTVLESESVNDVIAMLGYSMADFQQLPVGLNGYRSQLRHNVYPVSVQFDGNPGMGIHVDVSGSAISDVLAHFHNSRLVATPFGGTAYSADSFDSTVLCDLLSRITAIGHVTRVDLAIDDVGARFYTLQDLHDILYSGCYVSKFRTWKELVKYGNRQVKGHTIYLGSRSSDIMLRVYDKQLEQSEKALANGDAPVMNPWVRWELELKKERASQAVSLLLSGQSVSAVTVGILSNYLRIVDNDNARIDRCSVSSVWLAFIDGIAKLKLYRPQPVKTLDDMKNWLSRQVAPSLASVVLCEGGSVDYLYKLVEAGATRLKKYQVEMVRSEMGGAL